MVDLPVHIRPATPADTGALWPLASALATSYRPSREGFEAVLRGILDDPHGAVLVADADSRLLGYVHVDCHGAFHADGMRGWVEELLVAEAHRRTGLGRDLMTAAETWARETFDVPYLALATRRAESFYTSIGYEASATYLKKSFR